MQGRAELTDLKYVQICGGFNNVKSSSFAAEIANNFSTVYGFPSYHMQGSGDLRCIIQRYNECICSQRI